MLNAVKTWTTDNFANILAHIDDKLLFFFCENCCPSCSHLVYKSLPYPHVQSKIGIPAKLSVSISRYTVRVDISKTFSNFF